MRSGGCAGVLARSRASCVAAAKRFAALGAAASIVGCRSTSVSSASDALRRSLPQRVVASSGPAAPPRRRPGRRRRRATPVTRSSRSTASAAGSARARANAAAASRTAAASIAVGSPTPTATIIGPSALGNDQRRARRAVEARPRQGGSSEPERGRDVAVRPDEHGDGSRPIAGNRSDPDDHRLDPSEGRSRVDA